MTAGHRGFHSNMVSSCSARTCLFFLVSAQSAAAGRNSKPNAAGDHQTYVALAGVGLAA